MHMEDIDLGEDFDFEQLLNESFEQAENNSVVDGIIVEINDDRVLVDVGQKIEGLLSLDEIKENGEVKYKVGDTISVMLMGNRGERPNISHKKVLQRAKFNDFIATHGENFEDIIVEGKVVAVKQRGGFTVEDENGCEYFMPLAQSFMKTIGALGKSVKAKVIKVNKNQGSIIISRKKLIEENKSLKDDKVAKILENNEPVNGVVKKITSYGMFVDLGGVDGLVNYNEISYKGPVNPANYYNEGDTVSVVVLSYDKTKQHLSLSIKAALSNPWEEIKDKLEVGDTITVTVSNFESYGAFVDLGNDIEGLLHISELSWNKNIKNPKESLTIGDEINVEVIELDIDKKRLRVSLKNLQEKPFNKFVKTNKVGDILKGKISTLTEFGAFITLGDVDGLLHNEEASWETNTKCKNIFKKGDEVEVKIIKIDKEKENISLSIKEIAESPAKKFQDNYKLGDIVKGNVKDKKDFGVFIKLENNLDGLIRTEDFGPLNAEEVKIGDELEAVVINIDTKRNRVRLSIKRLEQQQEREMLKSVNDDISMTLGDAIKDQFKK
ncbi:30S ribosomal protein S1 [Aliarcobacter thereius]|uniref:30S ribosomal protein S1 n=1 Tax=Aliarcobacter thereius LMG 24486 TaxID=1032240 RepID=A0A1C7WM12_9BACT|nr:30S ribosomal protein S1 [Aliarcobacter thereius]OCL94761.1 30S ribosomal protein S1 [Aliarcobacter thereius LMG 24486]QBF15363.1 30S ribosomal protein S1 [Aliarcobacter thereius LMG 24486]TLS93180.1 30S ribosomal protein S1 [Aliarcobacter thereius]TLT07942.1 30S ribosomal protein S1 [Aliarcobacter thereius]HJE02840.1 30S ribosomal protein S1 [Aliarcobacter thereius]